MKTIYFTFLWTLRLIGLIILLVVIWHHSHWSVALLLTGLGVAEYLNDLTEALKALKSWLDGGHLLG